MSARTGFGITLPERNRGFPSSAWATARFDIVRARSKPLSMSANASPRCALGTIKWTGPRFSSTENERSMGKSHQRGWISFAGRCGTDTSAAGYSILKPKTTESILFAFDSVLKSQMTKPAAREALRMEIAKQTGQNLRGQSPQGRAPQPSNGSFATAIFRFDRETGGLRRRRKR